MAYQPIITSLADDDIYKLYMHQVVFHFYPHVVVEYAFKCRNKGVKLGYLVERLRQEADSWCSLRFTDEELMWMRLKNPALKEDYITFLKDFRIKPGQITFECDKDGELVVRTKGLWVDTIFFEIMVLASVNEMYFTEKFPFAEVEAEAKQVLQAQIDIIKQYPQIRISEFGTRRRYSKAWQEYVFKTLIEQVPGNITGTSNMLLAMKYNKTAHGTCAHEYFSAHLALVDRIEMAQKMALAVWLMEYDGDLGTALTDTFTTDAFLRDFGKVYSNAFSSARQDSGIPYAWADKMLAHWKKMGIDPRLKNGIFTNSLNFLSTDRNENPVEIWKAYVGQMGVAFGIGTSLTNQMRFKWESLNIVMKMLVCNGRPVVKVSDVPGGKSMGDNWMLNRVYDAYQIKV